MKFIVSSSLLLKQLQQISGVIQTNVVLPILEDFLFEIEENSLTATATDLETVMRVSLEVEAREAGKVCIPARILMDSLKNLPDQPLTFTIDKNFGVELTSDSGKYKVLGENPANFPKEPEMDDSNAFTLPSTALVTAINKTIIAISNDDMRPSMTGVYFELKATGMRWVATDAHRLVRYDRTDIKCPVDSTFIVPKKPLTLLKNALPDNDDEISLSFNQNHMAITHNQTRMICRLIDARFPDYNVVIPADNPFKLQVLKTDFQQSLRRVSIFSNKSSYEVALSISGSQLTLDAQDIDFSFEGTEKMACQYNGEDMSIAFNARLLVELLGIADTPEVDLNLSTPTKACIIKPSEQSENEDLLMLIMPLMLKPKD